MSRSTPIAPGTECPRKLLGLSLFLATCLSSHAAFAERFFVSQQAHATNENSGTRSAPFSSIGFAISQAKPGDQIVVGAGDYRQEDNGFGIGVIPIIDQAGDKPITIKTRPGSLVVVKKFFIQNSHNINIRGFHLTGCDFAKFESWRDMPQIVRDGDFQRMPDFFAPFEERRQAVESVFETYFDIVETLNFESGFDLENCQRIFVANNTIRGYWAGVQCRGCDRITIKSNKISHTVNGIFSFLPTPSLTNSLISDNSITQSLDNGIDIRESPNNVRIFNNTIRFSGRGHISLQSGAKNCFITGNIVYAGGFYSETMTFPGSSAISINDCEEGNVIASNWIGYQVDPTSIDGNGIILDLLRGRARAIVHNNWIISNSGSGINTTLSPNSVIQGNVIIDNGEVAEDDIRGGAIKLSRGGDVQQTIVDNWMLWNSVGLRSSRTIQSQQLLDRNFYINFSTPLLWDGETLEDRAFYSIRSIRRRLGWEQRGYGFVLIPRRIW